MARGKRRNPHPAVTTTGLYVRIWNDVIRLDIKWTEYRSLFAYSAGRLAILDSEARGFFGRLERVLRDDIALAFTRLTDNASIAGHETASLRRLLDDLRKCPLAGAWRERLDGLRDSNPLRDLRNKSLAHTQLATIDPLPEVTLAQLDDILRDLRDLVTAIGLNCGWPIARAEHPIPLPGGGEALMESLERGRVHRECEAKQLRDALGVGPGEEP